MSRAIAGILLVTAALVWCSQAVRKAERHTGNDFVGYVEASRALYAGRDPYHLPDRFPYIYPLFLATIVRPFAAIPTPAASVTWFAIQALCLWIVLFVVARSVLPARGRDADALLARAPTWPDLPVVAVIVVAVFGDVLQSEFLNGQVNIIVLALALAAVHLRDDRARLAAALLGAAIALKLTPALFLVYWVVEGRYRMAAESVVWAAALMLSPWLVAGERLWAMYETYVREFILPRSTTAAVHPESIFFTPHGFWGWLTGAPPGRALIVSSSAIVIIALMAWHAAARARSAGSRLPAWTYAAATPLLSPMSEVHHLTALIPAFFASGVSAWRVESRFVALASAGFVVLIWIGRFDRQGPWYFVSLLALISAAASVPFGPRWGSGPPAKRSVQAASHGESSARAGARAGRRWGARLRWPASSRQLWRGLAEARIERAREGGGPTATE